MRRKESIRQIGNVAVKRNNQLGYTHYRVGRTEAAPTIDIYISDEMRKQGGISFRRLKELAIREITRIAADPYGETSIDPEVDQLRFRNRRAVNKVSDAVENEIGFPVAIKSSTGATPENLISQYKLMRDLEINARRRLRDLSEIVSFLPVYGAVQVDHRQFLIMEHLKGAKGIEDREVAYPSCAWGGPEDPEKELVFSAKEHPKLLAALEIKPLDAVVRWRTVERVLGDKLKRQLGDLAGKNVLTHSNAGQIRYTIIDQVPKGIYA